METNTRQEKIQAVTEICQYDQKLIDALEAVIETYEGGEDIPTDWWGRIMQGINYTVEVLNRVMDVLEENHLDKQKVNDALVAFNDAFSKGDNGELTEVTKTSLIPCLEHICAVGEKIS
jgi:hypothetical protein